MIFFVDGYNITKGDPATQGLSLEDQREALVARLRVRGLDMLGAGRIVVVFDGAEGFGASSADSHPVEVVFARVGTADDEIVRRAAGAQPGAVTLVTSDTGLARRVQAHLAGVRVLSRERAYDAAGRGAERKGRRPTIARDAGVPAGGNRITADLKKLWLADETTTDEE